MLKYLTVMVVDDAISARMFVSKMIKEHLNCQEVVQSRSADEALEKIASGTRVDWIISDWEMPGTAGDEFLYKIRSNPETAQIPFMIMTSRNDKDSFIMAAQAGVSDYLIKPFSAATLIQKIRKVYLSRERRLMERFKASAKIHAHINFKEGCIRESSLVDISEGGAMLKVHPNKKDCYPKIYDVAQICLEHGGVNIKLDAELVRMERDQDDPLARQFIMLAFKFTQIDSANMDKLAKLIGGLKKKLDESYEQNSGE